MAEKKTLKELFLEGSDEQIDPKVKKIIREKWADEPTSLQVLEALDPCVYSALASGFVVAALQSLYETKLNSERITH